MFGVNPGGHRLAGEADQRTDEEHRSSENKSSHIVSSNLWIPALLRLPRAAVIRTMCCEVREFRPQVNVR